MGAENKTKAELLKEIAHLRKQLTSVQQCPGNLARYMRAVSHDIKQPLGLIVSYAEFLLEMYQDNALDAELKRDIALIARRGRLASDLLTELLALLYIPQVDAQTYSILDMIAIFDRAHQRLANVISGLGIDIVVPQR